MIEVHAVAVVVSDWREPGGEGGGGGGEGRGAGRGGFSEGSILPLSHRDNRLTYCHYLDPR